MANQQSEQASGSGEMTVKQKQYKVFNDSVHGHIKMHPLLVDIIDTPVFQRLRKIKQMGGIYYVFPGASHNRFEHSLGVGHLAGELVRSLKAQNTDITRNITSIDMYCVQIAGLCHDLGHGPFSHLFEEVLKELSEKLAEENAGADRGVAGEGVTEKGSEKCPKEEKIMALKAWKHEAQSRIMFDLLIEYRIEGRMREGHYNDDDGEPLTFKNEDFTFIRELIEGPPSDSSTDWPYKGRGKEKSYLYEIVANKITGVDVDKMDYFSRDCHHLGVKSNFSHDRYVMFARVCTNESNEMHICTRDKEAINMYELFHSRYLLHYNVCQHRVKVAIETMITDALLEAEGHYKIGDKTISDALMDKETFLKLTDDILQEIMRSKDKCLKTSRKIIRRIEKRKIYKFVGGKVFKKKQLQHMNNAKWKTLVDKWLKPYQGSPNHTENVENAGADRGDAGEGVTKKGRERWQTWIREKSISANHFVVKPVTLNYGKDDKDPITYLQFYRKNKLDKSVKLSKDEVSYILPTIFAEIKVMLLYKGNGKLPKNRPIAEFWELLQADVTTEESKEESEDSSEESSEYSSDDELQKDC